MSPLHPLALYLVAVVLEAMSLSEWLIQIVVLVVIRVAPGAERRGTSALTLPAPPHLLAVQALAPLHLGPGALGRTPRCFERDDRRRPPLATHGQRVCTGRDARALAC